MFGHNCAATAMCPKSCLMCDVNRVYLNAVRGDEYFMWCNILYSHCPGVLVAAINVGNTGFREWLLIAESYSRSFFFSFC